jgi:subtilisin family serine protease
VHEARAAGRVGDGQGITVAVLDTGVDGGHPELAGRVVRALHFGQDAPVGEDLSVDVHGHGTHVAGLVAGAQVGVAPGATLVLSDERGLAL